MGKIVGEIQLQQINVDSVIESEQVARIQLAKHHHSNIKRISKRLKFVEGKIPQKYEDAKEISPLPQ